MSKASSLVIGTPGVGKSHFSLYFVYRLIQLGTMVVFDTAYNDEKVNYFLFKPDGYLVCADMKTILNEIGNNMCWYVVDGCGPRDFAHELMKMLTVDTSKAQQAKDYQKANRDATKFFMPCWDWSEINDCK
jgi:hypothetical protein